VRPTPFGREFIERARRVVDGAEALAAFAMGKAGNPDRPIRFGLIPTVAPYLLPEIFPALTRSLPELDFAGKRESHRGADRRTGRRQPRYRAESAPIRRTRGRN
jgi:DNA-binding transcriptional LysR family regulator